MSRISMCAVATMLAGMAAQTTMAATLLSDPFTGTGALDSTLWTTATSAPAQATVKKESDQLAVKINFAGGSHRAEAITQAHNFDPFSAPVRIDLTGLELTGTPTQAFASGYVMLGRATGEYYPNASAMAYAVSVSVRHNLNGTHDLYVSEFSDSASSGARYNNAFSLSGMPSALSLEIDGASATKKLSFSVQGATFTGLAGTPTTASINLSNDFTAANLSVGGDLQSRIAIGAVNGGTVTDGSSFFVDSITVSSVPEPTSLGLLAGVGLLLGRRRRSR